MSRYFVFQSSTSVAGAENCTTVLPQTVTCKIKASGQYTARYTNLMELNGPDSDIDNWKSNNVGKVYESTIEELNTIGQSMYPAEIVKEVVCEFGFTHTLISQPFDINSGQTWVDNKI